MDRFFDGKVVIITGGGRGIGAATAIQYAALGAKTFIVSRTDDELMMVQKQIKDNGGECEFMVADLKDVHAPQKIFEAAVAKYSKVDILVNNAAIILRKKLTEATLEDWQSTMDINVRALFFMCQQAFNHMKPKEGCSIVNISSLSGVRFVDKFPGFSIYCASKFAVTGLTEALAVEGRELGIRVNAVAPGAVNTKMLEDNAPELEAEAYPEDIANMIVDLSDSDKSRIITGSIVEIFSNAN